MSTTAITTVPTNRPMRMAQMVVIELAFVAVVVGAIVDGLTVMHAVVGLLLADAFLLGAYEQRRAGREAA